MPLNLPKYQEVARHLGPEGAVFAVPSPMFRSWVADKRLPNDVAEFLLGSVVVSNVPFPNGYGGIWPPEDIMASHEAFPAILAAGLLAVGSSVSGDAIAIDFRDAGRQAGFLSREELRTEFGPNDVRTVFVVVAESLDEMLSGISAALREDFADEGDAAGYPIDYYDALRRV